jgi:medium-chain acyl-[acyl-carrier-protein] hydrolase
MNGVPEDLLRDAELFRLFAPTLRADLELCERYHAESYREAPPLGCPLVALGGLADPDVSRADLDAWRAHTAGPFQLRMLPGDHFFVDTARSQVAEIVSRELYKRAAARP